MFREEAGQATVEAAFALPIALALVILLVQPGILLYDRHAASCRGDVPSARDNSRGGPFGGVQGVRPQAAGCGA